MNEKSIIATAGRVIRQEADALNSLAETLGSRFYEAVELMLSVKGRVVVSGMGKSGHVGRKIAATLASTGTPAQFIHPAEASHGDLGMMTRDDVALILSNSGETPELRDILAHAKRFSIPIIGVASRPDSSLLQQADIPIQLPAAGEACPMGLAPTTSTTMTLALGDALAVCLMEHRSFNESDYRVFHPGGNLGAQLLQVGDLMHEDMPLVSEDTRMGDTLIEITEKGFGVAGVIDDDGNLIGIITDGDLRRHMDGLLKLTAREVMTADPKSIRPQALAQEAVAVMNENGITSLFVKEDDASGKALGLIRVHDCLRAGVR